MQRIIPNKSLKAAVAGQPQSAHASHYMRRLCLPLSSALGVALKLWLVFIIIFLSSCSAQDSQYLVGRWSYDPERTLAELKARENVPPKIISCYEKQVCGYYIEIEYTPTTWQSIFIKGDIKPIEPIGYVAE